jgi:hypothetical protein
MSNIETFNTIVGLILADLYENFPVPINLNAFDYALRAGLIPDQSDINTEDEAPAAASIEWLVEEGFIRSGGTDVSSGYAPYSVLTQKGLQLLSIPDVLGKKESMGTQLASAAKSGTLDGLKEITKKVVCEGSKMLLEASIRAAMTP